MHILRFVLLSLFLPFTVFSHGHEQKIRDYINKTFTPAVALMYGETNNTKHFYCTATAFSEVPDGYLFVSASHCVTNDSTDKLFLSPDIEGQEIYYPAEVVAYSNRSKNSDFSVLHIKVPRGTFSIVELGHNPTQPGESIISVSSPGGWDKEALRGTVSLLSLLNHAFVEDKQYGTSDWIHNIIVALPNAGPGSSGSTIVCEDQMKACAILVGHGPGGVVVEPIERFEAWWKGVQSGVIDPHPPIPISLNIFNLILKQLK